MLTVLAQSTPSATELASWISVLFYLGGFIATLLGSAVAIKQLRSSDKAEVAIGGQPLEIRAAATFASKEEHKRLEIEVEKIDRERRTSVAQLHTKIDENTKLTSAHGGKLDLINQSLHQLHTHLLRNKQ